MNTIFELINTVLTEETQTLLIIYLAIFALEMISGVTNAIMHGEFESKIFREGLCSKSAYIQQMILVFLLSMMVGIPYLFYAEIIWVNCMEITSILENLDEMGCPMPSFIKEIVNQTKKIAEDKANNEIKK